jgi:hypothetical protein
MQFYVVELVKPQMTIQYMRLECWITKGTDTQYEYLILIALLWQQWLCKCTPMLHLYIHFPYFFVHAVTLHFTVSKVTLATPFDMFALPTKTM